MKNYVQNGDVLSLTAPYAVSAGDGLLVGSLFAVACAAAANGAAVEAMPEGVFDITALSTDAGSAGTKMYWDNTNKRLTTTSTSNTLVGVLVVAKASGDTTARVYVDGTIR
jgi:predicted RecA/RadA family phage recombinase